mmetsp:Transcript_29813/g.70970  ORF Transcript_29813/g.70970 Transcript_29813/m.70970 type:complete len:252 (-) Transcript_29813:386-1141(-)
MPGRTNLAVALGAHDHIPALHHGAVPAAPRALAAGPGRPVAELAVDVALLGVAVLVQLLRLIAVLQELGVVVGRGCVQAPPHLGAEAAAALSTARSGGHPLRVAADPNALDVQGLEGHRCHRLAARGVHHQLEGVGKCPVHIISDRGLLGVSDHHGEVSPPRLVVAERVRVQLQQRGPSFRRGLFRGVAVVRHAAGDVAPTCHVPGPDLIVVWQHVLIAQLELALAVGSREELVAVEGGLRGQLLLALRQS